MDPQLSERSAAVQKSLRANRVGVGIEVAHSFYVYSTVLSYRTEQFPFLSSKAFDERRVVLRLTAAIGVCVVRLGASELPLEELVAATSEICSKEPPLPPYFGLPRGPESRGMFVQSPLLFPLPLFPLFSILRGSLLRLGCLVTCRCIARGDLRSPPSRKYRRGHEIGDLFYVRTLQFPLFVSE